jgi:osmotically-inducible protein OsmY
MKRSFIHLALLLSLVSGAALPSCKNKKQEAPATTTNTFDTTGTAPVVIAPDDELTTGVRDATKDFPGVTASVNNGEVTLTGSIKRDRLPTLMQSVQALHPKKVNNNLTIEP